MRHRPQATSLLLAAPLLLGLALIEPLATTIGDREPEPAGGGDPLALFHQAAAAGREGDLATVRETTRPLLSVADPRVAREAQVLLGLHAHAAGELEEAVDLLAGPSGPAGRFEDWRLLILAGSLDTLGRYGGAKAAYDELLASYPRSHLVPRAILESLDLARRRADLPRLVELVDLARQTPIDAATGEAIERLAWEVGGSTGDRLLRETAARRLLIEHPLAAADLGAAELFRHPGGELDWQRVLNPGQLVRRARSLVRLELPEGALTTLDAVAAGDRGNEWYLVAADALIALRRGVEALDRLAAIETQTAGESAAVEWRRSLAALDASRARRGRANLPADERAEMRPRARGHLLEVARLGAGDPSPADALRALFAEFADDDSFETTLDLLRRLRRLAPGDTTGARLLWQQGWSEYQSRNYTGAIGYWRELQELYPESRYTRSGLYWSGRAHEHLGNLERARGIFAEIDGDGIDDFYGKHARARLLNPATDDLATARPTEPWPRDPVLTRAQLLTDVGLDEHAASELDALETAADPRAANSLRAVILARQGKRRESIIALWRAFPALGSHRQDGVPPEALRLYYPLDFASMVDRHSREQRLPDHLVLGMIRQESAFDANARSWAGARGLMQVMPATAQELARRMGLRYSTERLNDPEFSIRLGTAYFRQVLSMFDGNEELALAGYNGGPTRIRRLWRQAGSDPELDRFLEGLQLEETKTYVKRVLLFSDSYRRLYAGG